MLINVMLIKTTRSEITETQMLRMWDKKGLHQTMEIKIQEYH